MRAFHPTRAALAALVVPLLLAACQRNGVQLTRGAPYYEGFVRGSGFALTSPALAHLTRVDLRGAMHGAPEAPEGYFRIDSTTRFVTATPQGLRWERWGVPGLMGARARVWLRNDRPTSLTAAEVWGDARLVVIDSAASAPAAGR